MLFWGRIRPEKGATMSDTGDRVDDAAERIEAGLERVEAAIKAKWSGMDSWLVPVVLVMLFWSLPGNIWHSRWRYAAAYGISSSDVHVQDKPHNCAFLAAPLGNKYCHYDPIVMITRWGTSQADAPIVSYDDGKTWSAYTPNAGENVPKFSTVKVIFIGWEKKED